MREEKILIVDDERVNLEFFDVMLTKFGFTIETAVDGEQALEQVRECNPDLIILDNIMPNLSGWETAKILKHNKEYAAYADIPIIMFSAMDDVQAKVEGFDLGIEDYITKPFSFPEVLARIKAVLRGKALARQLRQREKHIALTEILNKSLLYFTRHVKKPTSDLLTMAQQLDSSDAKAVTAFTTSVIAETREILATLKGLEEEVYDLQTQSDKLREDEVSLESLEEKYQKHFDSTDV